jgi:hypothetical protein
MNAGWKYQKMKALFRSNSGSGGPSVLDMLQNQLCPSNCSNTGYCNMSMYDNLIPIFIEE